MPWREDLKFEHSKLVANKLWRERRIVDGQPGRLVSIDGNPFLNFCSNDYLGLANHPTLKLAATKAITQRGTSSSASHLVCGHSVEHHRLEEELARFVGSESALVFSTGYMANLAVPQTFLGRNDLVLEDRLNHASLIDAGRHCEARMKRYPHLDPEALATQLARSDAPRKMVMTDGVFSMDGDIAPLNRMHEICQSHNALLVVDDAHGFGVLGKHGSGTLESAGLRPTGNVIMIGTFGKSAGSFGAFVAGDDCYIQSLIQHARTYTYTTALPPAVAATTTAAIKLFQSEPDRRANVLRNIEIFRDAVSRTELKLLDSKTPIQPIVLGSSESAIHASQLLAKNQILVSAIRTPTVPVGSARLRITLTADHTPDDVKLITDVLGSEPMVRIIKETQ